MKLRWKTEPPERVRLCLLTRKRWSQIDGWQRYTSWGNTLMNDAVAYMPIPHIIEDPTVWESPYNGGDWPDKDDYYICCWEPKREAVRYDIYMGVSWYDRRKDLFGGRECLGWMKIPSEYKGKKEMQHDIIGGAE